MNVLMQKARDGTRPCAAKNVVFDRKQRQGLAGQGASNRARSSLSITEDKQSKAGHCDGAGTGQQSHQDRARAREAAG